MDLNDLRKEYHDKPLHRSLMRKEPMEQFAIWFEEAKKCEICEPNAMFIATVNKLGIPTSRTVLLKKFDHNSLYFFTNSCSQKGRDIEENNHVAITFLWKELERQVNFKGKAIKTSRAFAQEYFSKRPRGSQIGALASNQSEEVVDRSYLELVFKNTEAKYQYHKIPLPENWSGYQVVLDYVEFWQGRPNRLHDRIAYQKTANSWILKRLSP
ncbi:MAG: pyridoxamine 5'-phosphate oxidase [Chlamydia sp. 32-24]|nr:MAG: pyridoxamine 5'-phosphate oxidase [Chlamydia sp. 32-24]